MPIVTASDFDEFFLENYAGVCRAVWLALGPQSDPEDATQEAFARAYRKWGTVSSLDRPGTWVYVVAVREASRQMRRNARARSDQSIENAYVDKISEVESRLDLLPILNGLPQRQRIAIVLRFYADLPLKDIAKAMGCREGTVKATIHSALSKLRGSTFQTTGANDA